MEIHKRIKKLAYLPIALLLLAATSCSMHSKSIKQNQVNSVKPAAEKELYAVLSIKDTIKIGDSVRLQFTVYNQTDSVKKFLKWQTPFEPLLSKYLEVKNEQDEEVEYKGAMAKRMMPPPPAAYITLNPKDSLTAQVDILKGYALTKPAKYTITYTSENVSGLATRKSVSFVYR